MKKRSRQHPSKMNRLNLANHRLAVVIRALNREGYAYTQQILVEMGYRKQMARRLDRAIYPVVEWAAAELEARLAGIMNQITRTEAIKRIDAVSVEYDEAMCAMEAFQDVEEGS